MTSQEGFRRPGTTDSQLDHTANPKMTIILGLAVTVHYVSVIAILSYVIVKLLLLIVYFVFSECILFIIAYNNR